MFAVQFDHAYFYGSRQLYRSKMKTFFGFMLECCFLLRWKFFLRWKIFLIKC